MTPSVAYCGIPAIPAEVWGTWNFDPVVMLVLCGCGVAITAGLDGRARRAGLGAVALLTIIFVSPLCALGAALFSARVVHHVLLVAGAAPLLALAFPARREQPISILFLLHLAVLWFWHVPAIYAWAIGSLSGYWLMQASLLGAAVMFWREVLRPEAEPAAGVAALLGTVAQMGLLGALITFASRPLYPAHAMTTEVWGFSPLEDQQLAGLIMWAPAILPYLLAALILGMGRLFPPEAAR